MKGLIFFRDYFNTIKDGDQMKDLKTQARDLLGLGESLSGKIV